MSPKKTVTAPTKGRTFYDRKVQRSGYTRLISVGKIIPKDWRYVRLLPIEKGETYVEVRIIKLLEEEINDSKKVQGLVGKNAKLCLKMG